MVWLAKGGMILRIAVISDNTEQRNGIVGAFSFAKDVVCFEANNVESLNEQKREVDFVVLAVDPDNIAEIERAGMLFSERAAQPPLSLCVVMNTQSEETLLRVCDTVSLVFVQPADYVLLAKSVLNAWDNYADANRTDTDMGSTAREIEHLLQRLGFHSKHLGYGYLIEGLEYVSCYKKLGFTMTDVYTFVAQRRNTRPKLVERCIRHAIERAWLEGNIDAQWEMFGDTLNKQRGKPTNLQFVKTLNNRLLFMNTESK